MLTFLAGAELDPQVFRLKWKEAAAVGLASFLFPFLGCAAAAHVIRSAGRLCRVGSLAAARPYAQPTFAGFRTALVGVAFSQQPGRKPFGQEPPRPRTIAVMAGGLALPGM